MRLLGKHVCDSEIIRFSSMAVPASSMDVASSRAAGPATAEESDQWVERFFGMLERAGQGPLLRTNLQSFFRLTTDYSGPGS